MNMKSIFAAAVGLGLTASIASAGIAGDVLNIQINHTGGFGFPANVNHTYGGPATVIPDPGFPQFNFSISSPGGAAGFDNSLLLDFTNFAYTDFAGETFTLNLTGLSIDAVDATFLNSAGGMIGTASGGAGGTIDGSYMVNDVLNAGDGVTAFLAWNNVPAPGALALLGMAGLVGVRRRRN